ncbi:MAG TPA: dihydropteroate synthase [Clostridia bacterium]|nr:dihydropteroate synthase [Clostridia bacterium]
MIIIGEKLNSSVPSVKALMDAKNSGEIIKLARAQTENGARFIDINAGMFLEKEPEMLAWLAGTLAAEGFALSIDTPSHEAARAALEAAGTEGNVINSVTTQKERFENMAALAAEHRCGVVALCMQDAGTPENLESRLSTADELVSRLTSRGVSAEDIYIDPMLRPLGADETAGLDALETISRLSKAYPECSVICGLSNLSFGLPKRKIINRAFAVAAVCNGLNAAILDPLDRDLLGLVSAAEAISGKDEYCLEYISKCREGRIG